MASRFDRLGLDHERERDRRKPGIEQVFDSASEPGKGRVARPTARDLPRSRSLGERFPPSLFDADTNERIICSRLSSEITEVTHD